MENPGESSQGKALDNYIGTEVGNIVGMSVKMYICICMRQCVSWMRTKFESQNHYGYQFLNLSTSVSQLQIALVSLSIC